MTKLTQLQHPDTMHLEAAAGWIQLGDYDSANDELEKIRAEWRAPPMCWICGFESRLGYHPNTSSETAPPSFSGSWRR